MPRINLKSDGAQILIKNHHRRHLLTEESMEKVRTHLRKAGAVCRRSEHGTILEVWTSDEHGHYLAFKWHEQARPYRRGGWETVILREFDPTYCPEFELARIEKGLAAIRAVTETGKWLSDLDNAVRTFWACWRAAQVRCPQVREAAESAIDTHKMVTNSLKLDKLL